MVLFALVVPLTGAALATHTTVDAEPENDRNAVGSQHTVTATTSNAGQEVNFDVQGPGDPGGDPSDFECQTDAQAPFQCAYTYSSATAGTDTINVWSDEEGNFNDDVFQANEPNDQVQKVWVAQGDIRVDCTPDADTNPEGFTHTVTCTMSDANGTVQGGQIDAEFLAGSPNDPGGNESGAPADANNICDAGESAAGQCTFTWTGNNPGTDEVCFFVDEDANDDVDDADCATEAGQGGTDDADDADVVLKTWQRPARLDCTPESDTNPSQTTHQINCVFTDASGNAIQLPEEQLIDFEIISGPNANLTPGFRDFECPSNNPTTNNNCNAQYTDQAGFDANNATDVICAWISHDGDDDQFAPAGGPEDGGECDNEAPGADGDNDETDVMLKSWQAPAPVPATQVNAEPETDTNPVGTQHTIGVFAGGANNQPTTSTPIRADIRPGSPNQQNQVQAEINCVQDNTAGPGITFGPGESQTHECSYTGQNAGTDTVRVFADSNNNGIFDQGEPFDDVTKTWSGAAFALAMTPDTDSAPAGTCNEFTVTITDANGNPVVGQIVDVQQSLQGAGNEPGETRELSFCDPPAGPNPTTPGGPTQFTDVQNNPTGTGQPGAQTTVHAEVGPTNNQGQVTFGITINDVPQGQTATVNVRSWIDTAPGGDNDVFNAGEPTDTSVKTWTPGGAGSVTALNAEPETATNPIGTSHQVTVQLTPALPGVTPNSIIANNAQGRQAGDVANPNAGNSPNATGGATFNAYNCTPSNNQGVSTCTFADPGQPGPTGTDTIVFYVNQAGGGTPGPDASEPQDAVQKTWTPGPQGLNLDVQCAGMGTNDDQDVGEQGGNEPGAGIPDCTNPLSDSDEVFTAIVTNPNQNNVGVANIRVDFQFGAITSGGNNTANDATLNATGGGQIGTNPNTLRTFCITDATGRCTVTLNNATPAAGDTIEVVGTISGQTSPPGIATDGATKQWQSGVVNQGGTITLSPSAATNQVNTQHTVTATVRNQFGQPVQGASVDFRITNGPNAGLSSLDVVTDATGNATFTYSSPNTGTDTIMACTEAGGTENDTCNQGTGGNLNQGAGGEPTAIANKTWQTGPVTTNAVGLDMDADDVGGCELGSATDANRETTAQNTINPTPGGALAAGNFHRICAAAFQTNQVGNQGRLAGAQITFTIQGPGRIFAPNANGQCNTNAQPAAGTTVTVAADNNGIAFACLYSQQVGRTTVTATSGTPAQTATGTKDWVVSPNTARFIQLCHGDIAGTTCVTGEQSNEPGDEHEMTARVTDAQGNPVANVPVQFRETGPGIFTPQGGSSATVNTDANGLAAVLLTSDVEGTSTIVAEIDPGNTTARQAGANNDECEAPAGTNNQPAAGNCISQTLTKVWDDIPPDIPECDDGLDNDGDDLIDFGEDPGCIDDNDNSELPVNLPPTEVRHDRSISIRFQDGTGARNNGLVVFGRVRAPGFPDCRSAVPVNVQRRVSGRWVTKKTTTTNRRGRYAVEIFDQASRYRAVAPRFEILDEDLNELHICRKAIKVKRHRHRR
ncbi:MAG: Ig-like domain-containing protein [Actinomycetota bacterium]